MKISLFLIGSLICGIYCISSDDLKNYLNKQAKVVNETLKRYTRDEKNFYDVKFNYISKMRVIGNYSTGEIFTIFNNSYALMDKDLYEISHVNYTIVSNFLPREKIVILKVVEYNNLGIISCVTNSSIVYIFGYSQITGRFFNIQNISHLNVSDLHFFENHKQLYMVVSNYNKAVIYKFVDSYFDEEENILLKGIKKIHTFSNNGSEIIIILRDVELTTVLYEFKENQLKKIQKINTGNSLDILSYVYKGKRYVLIFDEENVIKLYVWTGSGLVFSDEFLVDIHLTKSQIFYANSTPYLMLLNNNLKVFRMGNNQMEAIYDSVLNKESTELSMFKILSYKNQTNNLILLEIFKNRTSVITTQAIFIDVQLSVRDDLVEENRLSNCFYNLEKNIYKFRGQLTAIDTNKNVFREAEMNPEINEVLQQNYQELEKKYNDINVAFETYITEKKVLVVNDTITVENSLSAKEIVASDIYFEKLNEKIWQPERWLSYSISQKIFGFVKTQVATIVTLKTNRSIFDDLLLANGSQTISGFINVKNLTCLKFITNIINGINMNNLYIQSQPVKIKGIKRYPYLNAEHLQVHKINNMEKHQIVSFLQNSNDKKIDFNTNPVRVKNLWVDFIDGVDFKKFQKSVFRVDITNVIYGNLTFNNIGTKNMTFQTLSNQRNVMTISTDQTINSSVMISKIFAKNVEADTINGIDFKNSVVTFNTKSIKGPVSIKKVKVNNNLEMKGKVDKRYLRMTKDHIVGTNESDLLQRYNSNVTVKGNLYLKNLNLKKSAKIFISHKKFNSKFDQYWTKTTQQVITTRFEAVNGVSTPHLFANTINGVHTEDYMIKSSDQNKSTKFYFEDVTVHGNIVLKPNEQHSPNLRSIEKEAVKVNGTFSIKNHKIYSNLLKVDRLKIKKLNSINISELIDYDNYDDIGDPNKFQNLVIKGDLYFQNLSTKIINHRDLNELSKNTLYISEAQDMEKHHFKNISVKNLYVTELNGKNMDDISSGMKKIKSEHHLESVYIEGAVEIGNVHNLSTINDLSVNHLLNEANKKFHNNTVFGKVKFLGHVKVKDFFVTILNDVDLKKLTLRALYKNWKQNITQHITFNKIKTENLVTENINNIYVGSLVDITSNKTQNLFLPQGLHVLESVTIPNLDGKLNCDLHEAVKNLRNPLPQFWNSITINGNVTFMDKESKISQIFDKVITTNGIQNNVIRGKITFTNHICADNMTAKKKINNIDLLEIIEDAFIQDLETEQNVTGKKTFIQLEAYDVISLQNANVLEVNEIEISKINDNIIDKNSITDAVIKGKKVFFAGLQTKKFQTNLISGIKPENLVSFKNATKIPYAIFDSIDIRYNFNMKFLNKMPFDGFLKERLLTTGPKQTITGNYFFHNLKIKGNISTSQINEIKTEDVIYDTDIQSVESIKRFTEDLKIAGNMSVDFFNGFKLSETYEKIIMKNEDAVFNGSLIMLGFTEVSGNIKTNYINNFPMKYMLDTNSNRSLKLEADKLHEIIGKIAKFVHSYINMTIKTPTEFLYLEKSKDLQISVHNTQSAQIIETKNEVLIHIESEENGQFCGLPKNCKCPCQQTMQISSEHSISSFINKAAQRIYSYSDDDITVHLVTNTISTSSFCRVNATDEITSLTWNTIPQGNKKGAFFVHQIFFTEYISGVKFFTAYGRTYVIIAFYYNRVLDTYNSNCVIFQFNEDKSALEEIQRIPTERTKSISLIHTAQGIVLILGNEETVDVNTTTNIFRFNRFKGKFELLRQVPTFGTLYAVGVVLEMDSLIILANKRSTLYILKYQAEYDNYYFYQIFQLDYFVSSVSVFYAGDFGISDAYLTVVTKNSRYYIYSFRYIEGWKLESVGEIEGIKGLIPLKLNKKTYFFAPSSKLSSLLTLAEHDSG